MKNSKKIFTFLPLIIGTTTLPLVAASCTNTQKQEDKAKQNLDKLNAIVKSIKDTYKEVYTNYDAKLSELAGVLKSVKQIKDAQEKQRSLEELKMRVQNELKPLNYKYQTLFKLLRDAEAQANSKVRTVKIYHTNDEHGRIEFDDGKYNLYSGMLRTGLYLKDKPRDLLLSAGDMIQGLPLSDTDKGETIATMAKNIGYQAVAVGNHEFDYGLNHILNLNSKLNLNAEKMPFLSANIYYRELSDDEQTKVQGYDASKVGKRAFKPYIIRELENGVKVAVFGLTTPDTKVTSHPRNSQLVTFTEPLEEANKVIAEIKQNHPDIKLIICIAHLGKGRSNAAWTSEYLAQHSNNGLDLIIDGHSHTFVKINNENNDDVYVTQTEAYTKYLGDIELEFDTESGKILSQRQVLRDIYQVEVATLADSLPAADENLVLLNKLKEKYSAENDVIKFNSPVNLLEIDEVVVDGTPYWRGRVLPTAMGQIFANAGVWNFFQAKTWEGKDGYEPATIDNSFGLVNGGGLRANIAKGPVKYGDLRAVSPFGNRPNVVRIKGDAALATIKYGISKARSGGFSQLSSNITYEAEITKGINPKTEKEEYLWKAKEGTIKINGKSFEPAKYYYVATNDYLAAGGDGYSELNYVKNPEKVQMVYEGSSLIEEAVKYILHVENTENQLDLNKLEKRLEEIVKPESLQGQLIIIPEEATRKPAPVN
ncbi:bifunctional metallophosphatase/5'-nucleotidase [Mycoplasma buteonis]|uniref:bifunctional metallophosphatase/5'-nucleotidase n=1 Tax=Mycoplasma buteonis TaxID=171280 RepID=UPI00056BF209|nr:5'-nucleotidase C-terminal domain-containing protein [Mycoplasma buteonis]